MQIIRLPAAILRTRLLQSEKTANTIFFFSGFSFNLLALLFLAHGIPRARDHTIKYFTLSYYNPQSGLYGIGWYDTYFTAFCVILFTLLRAAVMEYVLAPFAKSQGVSKRKDITRFSEQAWLLMYYSVFWSLGVVSWFQIHAGFLTRWLTSSQVHLRELAALPQSPGAVD